jgi:hypothetical protein
MDFRTAADRAIDRIEKQLVKYKDKLKKRNTESIRYENIKSTEEAPVQLYCKAQKIRIGTDFPRRSVFPTGTARPSILYVFKPRHGQYQCSLSA